LLLLCGIPFAVSLPLRDIAIEIALRARNDKRHPILDYRMDMPRIQRQ